MYWSFNFSIIPSKEIPGLISFRMDWLDLLAVQWTLKSLLQHHLPLHKEGKSIIKGINEAKIIFNMRVPWTSRRSNQSILKEISPGISLEGMMLKLKLQYFGHLM